MIFNKNIGNWYKKSTYLDDVVYQLYLDEIKNTNDENYPGYQEYLIAVHIKYKNNQIENAYNIAKNIIRKEKIEKLNEENI